MPANYVNQVTGRRLDTQPASKTAGLGPRPAEPRVSAAILEGQTKYEEVKKRRNDVDAIVDAVMGRKRLEANYTKKDPVSDLKIMHRHAVDDQAVVMPGSAARAEAAGLEGVTEADIADSQLRQKVPNPSEVLRRYKMFSTEPQHPLEADAINLLNPEARAAGKIAPLVSAGTNMTAEFGKLAASGTLTSYAAPAGAGTAGAHGAGSGSRSLALKQNSMGSAAQLAGGAPVRRGGSGLVLGDVLVGHDYLIPASLVIAKWGRLVSTQYGAGEGEPNRMRCEVQPLYAESLVKDLETATGGRAVFTSDISPMLFLLDIGTVNSAVHGHRPSGAPPEPLEINTGGSYSVRVGAGTGEEGGQEEGSSSEEEFTETIPGVNGAPPTVLVRRRRKKKLFRLGLADAVTALMTGKEIVEDETRHRRRMRPPKAAAPMTDDDIRRAELTLAVENAKARANKLLFQVCKDGDVAALRRLLTVGFRANYEPNTWYTVQNELAALNNENRARHERGEPPFLKLEAYREHMEKMARRARLRGEGGEGPPAGQPGGTPSDAPATAADKEAAVREGHFLKKRVKDKVPEVYVLPDVNVTNTRGCTPLMEAARRGWSDVCAELLRAGAGHRIKNLDGQCALDLAKMENGFAAMALAAGVGGAVERKRQAAKTLVLLDDRSLMAAAQQGDMRRVSHLVSHEHHPVQVSNAYGMTPLHFAVMRADIPMVKFLVGEGADVHAENNLRQTPWNLAQEEGKKETKARLLKAMEEGKARADAEETKARIVRETAALRAKQEGYLVSELRTITKGTSAARAVQLALKADSAENDFKKVPGVPNLGLSVKDSPRHPDVERALASSRAAGGGGGSGSGSGGLASPLRASTASGGGLAAALKLHSPRDFSHTVLPRSISDSEKKAAERDLSSMPTMWTRHVLNYLAANKARAKIEDAALTRQLSKRVDMANAERRRQGPRGGGGGGGGGGPLATLEKTNSITARQNAADDEFRAALAAPDMVDEAKLRNEPVPDPSSRRFESWVRMRGLS